LLLQPHHLQGELSSPPAAVAHGDLTPFSLQVDEFLEGRAKGKTIIGCYSIEEMVANLAKPARVQLMVKAGEVVDQFIEQVIPHLSAGDIIIDGGNRRACSMLLCVVAACDPRAATGTTPTAASRT
jgi:NAD binding domain of 6-phosphogluconate dehydrogenase